MDIKEYQKKYRKEHKEYMKEWQKNNKKYILEYRRKYQKDNKEEAKKYYIAHRDNILERIMQYKKNNPDKVKMLKRQWYENNIEGERRKSRERGKIAKEQGKRRPGNPEAIKRYRKKWEKNNPRYHKEYANNKYKIDLRFNLNCKIKTSITNSLKNNKNGRHWEDLVGYILSDLMKHLKRTMPESYTWDDYIQGKLHIDHIIPISVFNFTKSEHIDFKRCWALGNLRLLPAEENYKKHNKLTKPFQPALKI
jgi:hypothetical protein